MIGVHAVAEQIGAEVKIHSEKLEIVDTEMQGAEVNMKNGNNELDQANSKGSKSNKCMTYALIGVGAFVLVLIFIIIIRRK